MNVPSNSIPVHKAAQETQTAGAFFLCWPRLPGCPGYAGERVADKQSRCSAAALCLDS